METSELSGMLKMVDLVRNKNPTSSSPSKYFFSWRINLNREVKEVVDD